MKKEIVASLLVVLILLSFSANSVNAQQTHPSIKLRSEFIITRYGQGIINETVTVHNNLTETINFPSIRIGLPADISRLINYYNISSGFSVNPSSNMSYFDVFSNQKIQQNLSVSFSLKLLLQNIIHNINNSIYVYVLLSPSLNTSLTSSTLVIKMPLFTQFVKTPANFGFTSNGSNNTYFRNENNLKFLSSSSEIAEIQTSSTMDFHPVTVFSAIRKLSFSPSGQVTVTDTISFRNDGVTTLSRLTVSPLTKPNSKIIVTASSSPPLLNPISLTLSGYTIVLSISGLNVNVQSKSNYTLSYTYQLDPKYYSVSGNLLIVSVPESPPIPTTVEKYTITFSAPPGVRIISGDEVSLNGVNIFTNGLRTFKSEVTIAWSADYFIPLASLIFFAFLIGFITTETRIKEEVKKERSPSEKVFDAIKAFEEKNAIVTQLLEQLKSSSKEGKQFFDEIRKRVDSFRNKALQRLNEAKQASTSMQIYEVINKIYNEEKESDRALRDLINLYEQYNTNRMRKDTFERLLPNYSKRLDRSLNRLSDLINEAQRMAKQA